MKELPGGEKRIFGTLGSVSLNDIIQLLGMAKRTATLKLRSKDARGALYFREGQIVHATAGRYEGEESFIELLGWADAEFAIEEGIDTLPRVSITKSTAALLLSTMTTLDEVDRVRGKVKFQIAPSIMDNRPPPRPKPRPSPRTASRFRKRTWLAAGFISFIATGVAAWSWVGTRASAQPVWDDLPAFASPATPSHSQQGVIPMADAWTVANTVWNEPVMATPPPPTDTSAVPVLDAAPAVARTEPAMGYVTIVVEPWGRIEIDGVAVGETPLGKLELGAGSHRITLVNDHVVGHIQDDVLVESGVSIVKRYSFEDIGYLRLVAIPWANVHVDGRAIGQTPLARVAVPTGSHVIRFEHPDLGDSERNVEVSSGQTALVRVQLE